MGCVNKSTKEFKALARHYNVSINQLEHITYKYWEETGSEEDFPTGVYIQAQLGKNPYQEKSKEVRELWEKVYSSPQTFENKEDYTTAVEEAEKYFPQDAIVTHKDSNDNLVLTIRKPVASIKLSIGDYINERLIGEKEQNDFELISDKLAEELEKNRNFAAANRLKAQNERRKENSRRLKATLAEIDSAAKSGEWSQESLEQLNNLIKNIKDGRIHFQRTVGERRSLTEGISEIHAGASLITRGSYGSSYAEPGKAKEQYDRDAEQGKKQEEAIEAWAKASDLWLNDYEDAEGNKANTLEDLLNSQWPYFAQGSEAVVHLYDENTVLKSINLAHTNDNVAKLLDKIALFNQQFPESALNIVGFGRDSMGHFRIIALQDFIQGEELSEEELQDFFDKYQKNTNGDFTTENEDVLISDLGEYNILKDANGVYHVIDADVAYNTPEKGGSVLFSNRLSVSDNAVADESTFDDLQMAIESRKRTHPFTFKDGTTVTAPFLVNQQQENALNSMNDFIHSNETSMTLSGYAGTGKTSIMQILARKMITEGRNIVFSATTNKAASVLKKTVEKAGFDAHTLFRAFGFGVEVDSTQDYDADNLIDTINDSKIVHYGDVVVIDEASMLNEKIYKKLNEAAEQLGVQIIYVGDKAQLAPVKENKISIVFRDPGHRVVELTQVERTGDNAILKEATDLRNGKPLSKESSFNNEGKGVAYISNTNGKSINDLIKFFVPGLKSDPDYFRILAYTNAAVARYNEDVRRALGYIDSTPRVGEPIIGYDNWGYTGGKKNTATYRFINSESYKVTSVGPERTVYKTIDDGTTVALQVNDVTIEGSDGTIDTVMMIDVKKNPQNKAAALVLAKEKARLWSLANKTFGKAAQALRSKANDISNFLFVNDNITERRSTPSGVRDVTIQKKVYDFGYALTVHKSQGSTFTHVLLDEVDINNGTKYGQNAAEAVPLGIEVGNEKINDFEGAEQTNAFDIDLGVDFDPEAAKAENTTEAANIRQQLKYVGVSRATDTVSIISKDVKKEDTPLNHLSKEAAAPQPEGQRPVEQMNKRELWEHLEKLSETMGERPVFYTPQGKQQQEYILKGDKIYNKNGDEVHYIGKDLNRILAKMAIAEDRAVVVEHRDKQYIVDNKQTITSVTTGDVMKWGPENGDRKAIIGLAEQKFRTLLENRQNRLSEMVPELMDLLKAQGINIHDRTDMEKFIKENPEWAGKVQQAIEEQEMQDIKAKAIADGTFMKAPNGKPTNLTERQWLQVRTKAFKKWFGDWMNNHAGASKVVDENGEPLVVYHGGKYKKGEKFSVFDVSKSENRFWLSTVIGNKSFFTNNDYLAYKMSKPDYYQREVENLEGSVYEVFLNLKNPLVINANGRRADFFIEEHKQELKDNEEIIVNNIDEDGINVTDYIVSSPNQIKSATDNNGEFSTENPDIQALQTSQGELYGFADNKGELYFDETKVSPNVQIHEYTHLWDRAVAQRNPVLWRKGVNLMKQTSLWNEILNHEQYGKKWQAKEGMTAKKLESLVASEVHARLVGTQGEALLNRIAKEQGPKGIVAKLKKWILDFWKELKATFSTWSEEEINALTLDDFNKMTVRDLVDNVNLKEEQNLQQQSIQNQSQSSFDASKAEFYSGAATGADSVWGTEARALGIKVKDYTVTDYDNLPENYKPTIEKEYREIVDFLGRSVSASKLVRRDMMQADKADAIFAIAQMITRPGETDNKGWLNRTDHQNVAGGTGYAVARGIIRGIPVYVFDQSDNQWKVWDGNSKSFVPTSEPTLTPHAATIGTRGINDSGRQAIKSILTKTVNQQIATPSSEVTMNIHYTTGDNEILSNFAYRHFQIADAAEALNQEGLSVNLSVFGHSPFNTVEGAFQAAKMLYSDDYYENGQLTDKGMIKANFFFNATGKQAKSEGRKITNLDRDAWDAESPKIMKALLRAAFQKEDARKALLETGDATLTHLSDAQKKMTAEQLQKAKENDRWIELFPKLLTEVREEIKAEQNEINQSDNRSNNKIEYGNDFRRIQETVRKSSQGTSVAGRDIGEDARRRLARITKLELDSHASPQRSSQWTGISSKGVHYNIIGDIPAQLFHDIFEVVRYYTENGELVDLHDDYSDCKCYLSDDGTCGFAIEPNGNLVSVFNLGLNRGFLSAIKDIAIAQGANHLDAFDSNIQPLRKIYEHALGAKVASTMEYNMEYDHDNIATNHGSPSVVFMVMGKAAEGKVEEKHFTKDQYDEAEAYQHSFLATEQSTTQEGQEESLGLPEIAPVSIEISLPGYEYFNDLYENTKVDAEWKIPLLQELDAQLSDDNTANENNFILDQMSDILQASPNDEGLFTSETREERPNLSRTQEEYINKSLDAYGRLNTQINNLADSEVITPSEVRHVAELVMNAVSDEVTRMQQEEGYAQKIFPSLNTELNFQTATRKEIINAVGIQRLLERQHELFNTETVEYDPLTGLKCDEIYDNWDGFLAFGRDFFAMNEGFGIKMNVRKQSYESTEGMHLGFESFNGNEDPDSVREVEGDDQEHWQIEQKTLDILNSASELVRMALHQCYEIGKDGNKVMSSYGIPERVNPRKAIQSILSWTRGAQTLEDMVAKLAAKNEKHPWLQQLINRLQDKSGKEADLQSQFFNTMCKSHQAYSMVLKENGKFAAIPLNDHPALSDILQEITAQYKMKEHPLFEKNGRVNAEILGNKNTTGKDEEFNLNQALTALRVIRDHLDKGKELTQEMLKEAMDNIYAVCRTIGFTPRDEVLEEAINKDSIIEFTKNLNFLVTSLTKALNYQKENADNPKATPYKPFDISDENNIRGTIGNLLAPITEIMDETIPNVVYDDGKLYQAFVTPSYLSLLMEKFSWEEKDLHKFLDEEYGTSEWFRDTTKRRATGWRNEWLRLLYNDEETRKIFKHKVELNFNRHRYMRNMSDTEYAISLLTHYFSEKASATQNRVAAWYTIPMQSNKPSSEFLRFWAYRGGDYKTIITDGLYAMFLQEISRIQTVNMRNRKKTDADFITNFDINGKKFNFLPFLNDYLRGSDAKNRTLLDTTEKNNELADLIGKLENMESIEGKELALEKLVKEALKNYNDLRAQEILDQWEKVGILEAAKNIKGIDESLDIRDQLENYIWNQQYAAKNILQLTIGDIAMYKNAEDLQKRLAQLHAPGIRPNKSATDYEGHSVSDGKYRTALLADFDSFKSNIIDNLREVFDRKIRNARKEDRAGLIAWRDALVGENGAYTKINVVDGQGYSSPSSYRKKAIMFGKWSPKAEAVYQKLLKGEFDATDLETAFQPLKPFVYAQLHKKIGVANSPIQNMMVPFQAKNSEYLLIMAGAILNGEETSRPNMLRAIYRIMEDSAYDGRTFDASGNIVDNGTYNRRGIDTIQFESAIKSGLQAPIDINQFMFAENGEERAYQFMKNLIYATDANGELTNEYNTNVYVHEADYNSYCLQQEVPEHFKNHSQAHGSQERMIIPSDLDIYTYDGRENYYEWVDPDGTKRKEKSYVLRKEYEDTIALNIDLSIEETKELFKLDSNSQREKNIALSQILQEEILDSPRYGIDLFQACSINEETGEFRIPKGDPIQAKRIEQIINSIIKSRINKQTIAGGPIVQVTNWGTSDQLNIRFHDRNGKILLSKEEFAKKAPKNGKSYNTDAAYDKYIKDNQAGIAYFEIYAPAWMNELYHKFTNDKDGSIDINTLELINPDLLKMISYRIPTEDKYSIAPMKIVGFLPKEAGSAIMLPYELTEIDDSDFDVDKRYVMRKEIDIAYRVEPQAGETMSEAEASYVKNNKKTITKHLVDALTNIENKSFLTQVTTQKERDEVIKKVTDKYDVDRRTAKREHDAIIDRIERKNEIAEQAITDAKWSNNEKKDFDTYDKKMARQEKYYQKKLAEEEERYQLALDRIKDRETDAINARLDKLTQDKIYARVNEFLTIDLKLPSEQDDALTRELRKAYINFMYHSVEPVSGRVANNNKVIDMTWGVLTNEMTADKILNPGGFEAPKNIAYRISAFKNMKGTISWNSLEGKSTDDLKAMSYTNKDLTWPDTQIQFYKQNAAAASLIGVFAVNKVAHATLEGNDIWIAVDEICGENPFTIGDMTFQGRMQIDKTYDLKGNLIGKTLGSMVSASADAVKDPILNLVNVNMTTAGILNTMLRLGMSFEDAVMFLSQNAVTKVLAEFNRQNLNGFVSLTDVINKQINKFKNDNTITDDSTIDRQPLTKEEMIQGLLDEEHDVIDYKVLQMFSKLKSLSDAMRKPTFATRFNSISSAVGPLIIDNLIMERKMEQFRIDPTKEDAKTGFYNSRGQVITIDDIFEEHPILNSFAKAVGIAKRLFRDMPAGSTAFKELLNSIPASMQDTFYNDKKLLDKLSMFYQSYLLIQSGLVDEHDLKEFIEDFPKEYEKGDFKKKYPDNELIQAIKKGTSRKTGRVFLSINITGEDEQQKETYRSAWSDLHRKNPELSRKLFTYCFFRGGIGFTPKTFMALLPNYVKERLSNGAVSYVGVFRKLDRVPNSILFDQFIRNNWTESKLVPKKGDKNTHYSIKNGKLTVRAKEDLEDLQDVEWMRVSYNNQTYLWKREFNSDEEMTYTRVKPLGDNNEYIEMSASSIINPMSETTLDIEDLETGEIVSSSADETDASQDSKVDHTSQAEKDANTQDWIDLYMKYREGEGKPFRSREEAEANTNAIRKNPQKFAAHIQDVFKSAGLELSREEAVKKFNEYC